MPIRSIDLQTMIPKTQEVQKIKSSELEVPKNNIDINIHKDQQQNQQKLQQVKKKEKVYEAKINKDQQKKKNQEQNKDKNNDHEKEDEASENTRKKIDIRI